MNELIEIEINGESLVFSTSAGLFSPSSADAGSLAMLNSVDFEAGQKVLDLGCGYGLVGIYAARKTGSGTVWMLDIDPEAIENCRINASINSIQIADFICADGPEILFKMGLSSSFDYILSNPPYHTDFSVARRFIESSYRLLSDEGFLVMVVKRLTWYRNKIRSVFGGVIVKQVGEYFILSAQKRKLCPSNGDTAKKTVERSAGSGKGTRKHQKKLAANYKKPKKKGRQPGLK